MKDDRVAGLPKTFYILLFMILYLPAVPGYAKKKAASSISERKIGYSVKNGEISATFGFTDIFTETVRNKLQSGLSTKIVLQIFIENEQKKQTGYWVQTADIVYDLWEENFVITITDANGKRKTRLKNLKDVEHVTGTIKNVAVGKILSTGTYRLHVRIEANPVSKKMIHNIQRWISRPSAGIGNARNSTNYFGSFVGYFVKRDIGKSDKTVIFVSQWFKL